MPKPRQVGEAAVSAVVFQFLKKLLDYYTTHAIEGKRRIAKKTSIKEGMAQGSSPSNLLKEKVQEVVDDPNNLKRVKAKVKKILEETKVKPTNDTAANMLLDVYKQDTRELRNLTELDQGVEQIFTDTFLDNLRERQAAGVRMRGEPEPVKQEKEEEQPQPEEDKPTPIKKITTKKKREVPPLIPKEVEEEDEDSDVEFNNDYISSFFNRIKKDMKTEEGKSIVEAYIKNLGDYKFRDWQSGEANILAALRGIRNAGEDINDNIVYEFNTYINKFRQKPESINVEELQKKLGPIKKVKQPVPSTEEEPKPIPTKEVKQPVPTKNISVPLLDEMIKNISRPTGNGTGVGLTPEELKAAREKRGKPVKKVPKQKPSEATTRAITQETITTALKEAGISTKQNVTTGFEEMKQRLDDINVRLASIPELKELHADVVKQLERTGYDVKRSDTQLQGLGISKKVVEELIKTIPKQNRDILAPAVRSIAGSEGVNMNDVVAGIVGLGISLTGNPAIGSAATTIISGILNTYDVDLQSYFNKKQIIDRPQEAPQRTTSEGIPNFGQFTPQSYFRSDITGATATADELREWLKENKDIYEAVIDRYPADALRYKRLYDIYLKKIERKEESSAEQKGILSEQEEMKINEDVYDVISGVVEEAQPEASPETKRNYIIDSLLALPETIKRKISEIKRNNPSEPPSQILKDVSVDYDTEKDLELGGQPPRTQQSVSSRSSEAGEGFVQGAGVGGMYGGLASGISTGSAQGAISGIIPGAIAGGVAGLTTEQLLRRYYRQQGIPITDDVKQRIKALSSLPAVAVAAYLGYTPSGQVQDVVGQGVTSGAGITEKKITVTPDVLAKTKAQVDQEDKTTYKVWQPKTITPTPDILDESKQEKYADDVEFIAFNYIPPTSEGAEGTVDTNPLKYQQLLESKIRYTDAGVYIPYVTWNKINDANNMTKERLQTMALGPKLPEMKFETFDNDTTFENVAKLQFVNGENTAVEFQSPYADFSNVENSWWTNPTSELFTINS